MNELQPTNPTDITTFNIIEGGTVEVVDAMTKHELDVAVVTAKRFPRSIEKSQQRILTLATLNQATAETCTYSVPRGNKKLRGPSIRFAEMVAHGWGHLRVAGWTVREEAKRVVVRGMCWDLETNVSWSKEVPRTILRSNGTRYGEDMITTTSLAAIAIAQRNALFNIVPGPLWQPILEQVQLVALGDKETLEQRRRVMLAWFEEQGIKVDHLLAILKVKGMQDVGMEEVAEMRQLAQAIKEGAITVETLLTNIAEASDGNGGSGAGLRSALRKTREKSVAALKAKGEPAGVIEITGGAPITSIHIEPDPQGDAVAPSTKSGD